MFYRAFRFLASLALRLFFRIEPPVDAKQALATPGAVIFVANHPNGLIDPGILFALTSRPVTFLAKSPLFALPVLGWILKGLDALPVFRAQDNPGDMAKNEGTLTAATNALVRGRAITLFPEGKSHSEPQLASLKTGCARIALEAVRKGQAVTVVPVGLTYSQKGRFKSRVHVEVGTPLAAREFLEKQGEAPHDAAKRLTAAIFDALRAVTLNLEQWEDLPIVEAAEALYALEKGDRAGSLERQKAFARGMALVREEEPARFEALKVELRSYRQRLDLLRVTPDDVDSPYRPATVARFVARNLVWLLGLPFFALGMVVFAIPFWIPIGVAKLAKAEDDIESTVKVLTLMLLAPAWWMLLVMLSVWQWDGVWLQVLIGVPPLALFTRMFFERRGEALHDARVFVVFWNRRQLKARLLEEGRALAKEVAALAERYQGRVVAEAAPAASPSSAS